MAKEAFKAQLRKNEQLLSGQGPKSAGLLKGQEEVQYQNSLKFIQETLINYFRDMDRRGYLSKAEKKLIKSGVVFRPIKLAVYGMRPEELNERALYIKSGKSEMLR